jgi:hypothetical protein
MNKLRPVKNDVRIGDTMVEYDLINKVNTGEVYEVIARYNYSIDIKNKRKKNVIRVFNYADGGFRKSDRGFEVISVSV